MKNDLKKYFSKLGKKGGRSTSDKKVNASRLNGKLGGRPKKNVEISLDNPNGLGYTDIINAHTLDGKGR